MKHRFKRLAAFTMVLALILSMAISFGAAETALAGGRTICNITSVYTQPSGTAFKPGDTVTIGWKATWAGVRESVAVGSYFVVEGAINNAAFSQIDTVEAWDAYGKPRDDASIKYIIPSDASTLFIRVSHPYGGSDGVMEIPIDAPVAPTETPKPKTTLGDYAVGDIVKLRENDKLVEFRVIQKGRPNASAYDDSFNNTITLLRENYIGTGTWPIMTFGSLLDYLNTTGSPYINQLDPTIRTNLVAAHWPANVYNTRNVEIKITIPSEPEMGGESSGNSQCALEWFNDPDEASLNNKRKAVDDSGASMYGWTRTSDSDNVRLVKTNGKLGAVAEKTSSQGIRPMMCLPADVTVTALGQIATNTGGNLDSYAVGSIVQLKENGRLTDFIVVQKDNPDPSKYDASFDDAVILRRLYGTGTHYWNRGGAFGGPTGNSAAADSSYTGMSWSLTLSSDPQSNSNGVFQNSELFGWLNDTYLSRFNSKTQDAIVAAKWPYTQHVYEPYSITNPLVDVKHFVQGAGCESKITLLTANEVNITNGVATNYEDNLNDDRSTVPLDYFLEREEGTSYEDISLSDAGDCNWLWSTRNNNVGARTTIPKSPKLLSNRSPGAVFPAFCLSMDYVPEKSTPQSGSSQPTTQPTATATQQNTPLKNLEVGTTVYIKENNIPVAYLVVQKGTPSGLYQGLDGSVILHRKAPLNQQLTGAEVYENSAIDRYLTGAFTATLDPTVQSALRVASWPHAVKEVSYGVASGESGLKRSVMLLSRKELGGGNSVVTGSSTPYVDDGTCFTYYKDVDPDNINSILSSSQKTWTRTPSSAWRVWYVNTSGMLCNDDGGSVDSRDNVKNYIRPALCLDGNAILDSTGTVVNPSQQPTQTQTPAPTPVPTPEPTPTPIPVPDSHYKVGDTVQLLEDGKPVDFTVVHLGNPDPDIYDERFNNVMFLLRKNYYGDSSGGVAWDPRVNGRNNYDESHMHEWLNGEYLSKLDPTIQNAALELPWPYMRNEGKAEIYKDGTDFVILNDGVKAKVVLPSVTEFNQMTSTIHRLYSAPLKWFTTKEGSAARMATYDDGASARGWTRSSAISNRTGVYNVSPIGNIAYSELAYGPAVPLGARPMLCLPANIDLNVVPQPTSTNGQQTASPSASGNSGTQPTAKPSGGSQPTAKPSGGSDQSTTSPKPSGSSGQSAATNSPKPSGSSGQSTATNSPKPSGSSSQSAATNSPNPSQSSGGTTQPTASPSGNATAKPSSSDPPGTVTTDPTTKAVTCTVNKYDCGAPDAVSVKGTLVHKGTNNPFVNADNPVMLTDTKTLDKKGSATLVFQVKGSIDLEQVSVVCEFYDKDGRPTGPKVEVPGGSGSEPSPSPGPSGSPSGRPSSGSDPTPTPSPSGGTNIGVETDPASQKKTITVTVDVDREKYPDAVTVTGTLVDKTTGEPILDANGNPITVTAPIDPATGKATLVFRDIDPEIADRASVRVEYKDENGNTVGERVDIDIPGTNPPSVNPDPSGQKSSYVFTVPVDKERFPNAASVAGTLIDTNTGQPILDANGNPITVTAPIDPETGIATLIFKDIDASLVKGHEPIGAKVDVLDADGNVIGSSSGTSPGDVPVIPVPVYPKDPVVTPEPGSDNVTVTIVVPVDKDRLPGAETVTGVLVDKNTREPIRDGNGNLLTASAPVDPVAGEAVLQFKDIDPKVLEGHELDAVIEVRDKSGNIIGTNSGTQPGITIPGITVDPPAGITDPVVTPDPTDQKVTITVTVPVDMSRLPDAKTVTGILIDKATGEPIRNEDGSLITASAPIDPETGKATLVFKDIDRDVLEGHDIGVRVEVRDGSGKVIATNDGTKPAPGETEVPPITLPDPPAGIIDPTVSADPDSGRVTITVTVPVDRTRLPDAVSVTGTLIDKATGQPILDANGNPITASAPISPDTGKATLTFRDIDRSLLEGHDIGVKIEVKDSTGKVIATNDGTKPAPGQSEVPEIKLPDVTPGPGVGVTDPIVTTDPDSNKVTIIVTVPVDKTRLPDAAGVSGTLIDKTTKEDIRNGDGSLVTASAPIDPWTNQATLVFRNIDREAIKGHEPLGVRIDVLDKDGKVIATNDGSQPAPGQSEVPEIRVPVTGITDPVVTPDPDTQRVTITVTVPVDKDSLPNADSVRGVLIDKNTGQPILDADGKPITAYAPIDPETGKATLTFTDIDPEILTGHDVGVRVEVLDKDGNVLAANDGTQPAPGQSEVPEIKIPSFPKVDVTDMTPGPENGTIVVKTHLTDLTPATNYKVTGWLVFSSSGQDVVINDAPVTAETTFRAISRAKDVELTFSIPDMALIKGQSLTARFQVDADGQTVTVAPPDDKPGGWRPVPGDEPFVRVEDITVTKPSTAAGEPAEVTVTIGYEGLEPGTEYVLTATLINKDTGEPVLVNGQPVQVTQNFRPDRANGTLQVTFSVNPDDVAGITLAVASKINRADNGELVAESGDNTGSSNPTVPPLDGSGNVKPDRTPEFADITGMTMETDPATGRITIIATGHVDNLDPNEAYTITATLIDAATGRPILMDGRQVKVIGVLNPVTGDVTFTFRNLDPQQLQGHELGVLMEVRNSKGEVVAIADSVNPDPSQSGKHTLVIPPASGGSGNEPGGPGDNPNAPGTTITPGSPQVSDDNESGNKLIKVDVPYSGLEEGHEYEITGVLIDRNTGLPILDKDGNPVTFTQILDPGKPDGTVQIVLSVPPELLEGKDWDVKTTLWKDGQIVWDSRGDQNVAPTVSIEGMNLDRKPDGELSTLTVTAAYTGVPVGVACEARGMLVSTTTGQPVNGPDGKPYSASATFIPLAPDGTVQLTFTFDTAYVDLETTAVHVSLVHGNHDPFASGGGRNDPNALIIPRVPGAIVTATQLEEKDGRMYLVATVNYKGLDEGEEYRIDGLLVDMTTGLPVGPRKADVSPVAKAVGALFGPTVAKAAGEITAYTIFTPITPSGSEKLAFEFNKEDADLTNAGVKATLYKTADGPGSVLDEQFGTVTDPDAPNPDDPNGGSSGTDDPNGNGSGQNGTQNTPAIEAATVAAAGGGRTVSAAPGQKITGAASLIRLAEGTRYTLTGTLMKQDGSQLLISGSAATGSKDFFALSAEQTVSVPLTFDATGLAGSQLCIAWTLLSDGAVLSEYTANLSGQLISVVAPSADGSGSGNGAGSGSGANQNTTSGNGTGTSGGTGTGNAGGGAAGGTNMTTNGTGTTVRTGQTAATGDTANLAVPIICIAAAGAFIAFWLIRRKKLSA